MAKPIRAVQVPKTHQVLIACLRRLFAEMGHDVCPLSKRFRSHPRDLVLIPERYWGMEPRLLTLQPMQGRKILLRPYLDPVLYVRVAERLPPCVRIGNERIELSAHIVWGKQWPPEPSGWIAFVPPYYRKRLQGAQF